MQQENPENQLLIVDDDTGIRETMREFIQGAGFTAITASSAENAIEVLDRESIQVVITDIMLPGMGGLQLTDVIRKKYNADVIVMTGYSGDYSYEEAVNIGASDFVIKPVRFEELLLRVRRVMRERRLAEERVRMMEKLQKLATTDGLTKLFNSRSFYNQLEMEVDRSVRYNRPLSLLLLDIDFFKNYNDTYGHLEGDKVLIRFAQIARSCLRSNDSAYRYGGEEFTIILPETACQKAETVAERIRRSMEKEVFEPVHGKHETVTISIGVTQYEPKEELSAFVHRADRAMYTSKQNGRNRTTLLHVNDTDHRREG